MLGSSLEFVDSRWDSLDVSPPPTPPPSPGQPPCLTQALPAEQEEDRSPRTVESISGPSGRSSLWDQHKTEAATSTKPGMTATASWWEPQRHSGLDPDIHESANPDSKKWDQQSKERKPSGLPSIKLNSVDGGKMWEQQRLRSRDVETKTITEERKPAPVRNKKTGSSNPAHLKEEMNSNIWKNDGKAGTDVESEVPQQSKKSEISSRSKLDSWDLQETKRSGGTTTTPKRDANLTCQSLSLAGNSLKLDAAWQRNLTNVRVHIRDLGMKIASIQRDIKKDSGKVVGKSSRVKTRS